MASLERLPNRQRKANKTYRRIKMCNHLNSEALCARIPKIANVKRALHGTFHAVSKEHFCGYLAEFCG